MTAHETRIELANKQRMKKTKKKWIEFAERVKENFSELTEVDGKKIGDKIGFVKTKSMRNGCIEMSQRYGTLFAIGKKCLFVISNGKLERVSLE